MQSLKRIRSSMKVPRATPASYTDEESDIDEDERPRKRMSIVPARLRKSLTFSTQVNRDEAVPAVNDNGYRSFRFLDLPAELRLVFYESMFVKTPNRYDTAGVIHVCGCDFWDRPPFGDFHLWTHPLLRTNSQIRTEGLDVFFSKNRFVFDNEFNMNLFLNVIGDSSRERIRSVSIQRLPQLWFSEQGYGRHDWTRIENYMRMLARLPNLKSLKVERSPYYFQERSLDGDTEDEEGTWYPDINTMDVDDALRTAYLGWLPLHLRGLQDFCINWGPGMETEFNQLQRCWFREVERKIRNIVALPKPENYFQNRTKFIYKGYETEDHINYTQYAKFYLQGMIPRPLRYIISRPSSFFSTYAYDPEKYMRQRKWRKRRKSVTRFIGDCWWDARHPRVMWRRWNLRRTSAESYYVDDVGDFNLFAAAAADPSALGPQPPGLLAIPPLPPRPPPPPPLPLPPSSLPPLSGLLAGLQQAPVLPQLQSNDHQSVRDLSMSEDLEMSSSEPPIGLAMVEGNNDGHDDDDDDSDIPLESLTDSRASGSLPSLLRVLNID